eukprot:TRINITY_DN19098_c0_g1_i9.p1 TRINITY_DN19098_c0_g1~~TRINITY_DN19098_c0_g1_i9.p1  ORF type:complete len:438 (-),score=91.45 TRINITY_DN19098_c0_g1_i9:169-1482(-)
MLRGVAAVALAAPACTMAAAAAFTQCRSEVANLPVVVVGSGAIGSAAAASLAARGIKVVVIDEGHNVRSSWGDSRAAGLELGYTGLHRDMVIRSVQLWQDLQAEEDCGEHGRSPLLYPNQTLELKEIKKAHRGETMRLRDGQRRLTGREARAQFPGLRISAEKECVLDEQTLCLSANHCLHALQDRAKRHGAVFYHGEQVVRIDRERKVLLTDEGSSVEYSSLVLTAGPWTNRTLASATLRCLPLFVSAEQVHYLVPKPGHDLADFSLGKLPVVAGRVGLTTPGGVSTEFLVYTVPILPGGKEAVKCATHAQGELMSTPEFQLKPGSATSEMGGGRFFRRGLRTSQPGHDELDEFQHKIVSYFVEKVVPGLDAARPKLVCRCLYTNTEDGEFVVGPHPQDPDVLLATGFNGEGFKFAPVVGECLACLLYTSPSPRDS